MGVDDSPAFRNGFILNQSDYAKATSDKQRPDEASSSAYWGALFSLVRTNGGKFGQEPVILVSLTE